MLNYNTYLDTQDIINLKNYKYKPGEYTFLDNLMNYFWLMAVEFLPKVIQSHKEPRAEPHHSIRSRVQPAACGFVCVLRPEPQWRIPGHFLRDFRYRDLLVPDSRCPGRETSQENQSLQSTRPTV